MKRNNFQKHKKIVDKRKQLVTETKWEKVNISEHVQNNKKVVEY